MVAISFKSVDEKITRDKLDELRQEIDKAKDLNTRLNEQLHRLESYDAESSGISPELENALRKALAEEFKKMKES